MKNIQQVREEYVVRINTTENNLLRMIFILPFSAK